jgi:hypothetical protein
MAYSDFTLDSALRSLELTLREREDVFADVDEFEVGPSLRATMDENTPLAMAIHTEKARSELIVAPILLEVRRLKRREIGFFSGISFDVTAEKGLNGVCDFILSQSPTQLVLEAPVLPIVEAKNDNIKSGFGQCVAEMVAARIFNERAGTGPTTIFGAVTTGTAWRFLRLAEGTIFIDRIEYYLDRLEKILGILLHCVGGTVEARA